MKIRLKYEDETMIKKMLVVVVGLMLMGLVGCSTDEPETAADKAKESLSKAVEATKEAAHDTAAATKEAVHDAAQATKEVAHDAAQATEEAAHDAKKAMK
jgi:type IV secretory pathway VirB6-like protein